MKNIKTTLGFLVLLTIGALIASTSVLSAQTDEASKSSSHYCNIYNAQNQITGLVDVKYGKVGVPIGNGRVSVVGVMFSQKFSDDLLMTITGLAQGVPTVRETGKATRDGEIYKYNWRNGYPAVGKVDLATKYILDAQGRKIAGFDGCDSFEETPTFKAVVGGATEILGFFGAHILAPTFAVCPTGACEW